MREYIDALPSGSFVALSHFIDPETPELSPLARELEHTMQNSPMGSGAFRIRAEIEAMFPGLEMIEPGLVALPDWWPDGPRLKPLFPEQLLVVGGVGRKP